MHLSMQLERRVEKGGGVDEPEALHLSLSEFFLIS
jgi:hypothetical protein